MAIPIVHASATNLELSQEHIALIERKMAPLGRLLSGEHDVQVDVIIRRVYHRFKGDMFYVSAKLSSEHGTYMAVSTGHYLTRALSGAREYLRHSLSRGDSVKARPSFMKISSERSEVE